MARPRKSAVPKSFIQPAKEVIEAVREADAGLIEVYEKPKEEDYEQPADKVAEVRDALQGHVAKGLEILTLNDKEWHLRFGVREDSGNMEYPLERIVKCAGLLVHTGVI